MDGKLVNELSRWTVIAVSVITVIGFLWNIQTSVNLLHTNLSVVQRDIGDLQERMARVEVKLDGHLALPHKSAPEPQ